MTVVKEHYGDQLATLQRGGDEALEVFKELFLQACPKYLSVNPPPYEDADALQAWMSNPPPDAVQRHLDLFLSDVLAIRGVSNVRNLLKLYTSIDAAKLAAFLETSASGADAEEEVLQQLMVLKAASRTYGKGQGDGSLLDGDRIVTNNLDFRIDGTMVHVEETTSHRRYAGFFIRNAEHAQRVFNTIHSSPLPSQRRQAPADKEKEEKKTERKPQAWAPKSRQVRIAA
jgi:translation initiation factor 3 subunit L